MGARDAWAIATLLCLAAPTAAAGASSLRDEARRADSTFADTVLTLPEVRVIERRVIEAERRIPTAFTSEIRPGARGGALDLLPELLSAVPGVHVQQYGGLGAFSVMSMRGSSPGQVAVFLDGMPLTSAARGVVNLGALPISAVEKIEVYRGPTPLAFGLAGPGGAIDLVTPHGTVAPELRVARGSFDTWDARGFASRAIGRWSGWLHAGYQGSRGDFAYLDDNATPFNAGDDRVVTRANNRFDALTGAASIGWRPRDDFRIDGRGEWRAQRQGAPGLGSLPTLHTSLATAFGIGQVEAVLEGRGWARPRLALRAARDRTCSRFEDPFAELGLGTHDTDDRLGADQLELHLDWDHLPGALALESGGTLRHEDATLRDDADAWPDPASSVRRRAGGALGVSFRPWNERVLLHAGERWERLRDALRSVGVGGIERASDVDRALHAPQLGARVLPGLGLELKANWSKADRAPDFLELFGNQGTVLGNPALLPERLESWDAGAGWSAPTREPWRASLRWAHFESRARDLILYTRNSPSTVRAMNVSAARVRGE
ncbi:MAG: hypothetical protein E6K80_08510, partial [Candidatus Eisenbacteria bacterium]